MNNRPTASKTSPSCQQPVKVNKTGMDADTLPSPSFSLPVLRALISADSCSVFLPAPPLFFFPPVTRPTQQGGKPGVWQTNRVPGSTICVSKTPKRDVTGVGDNADFPRDQFVKSGFIRLAGPSLSNLVTGRRFH